MHHLRCPLSCSNRVDLSNYARSILSCGYALLKNTKVFEGPLSLFLELSLLLTSQEQLLCVRFAAEWIIGAFIYDSIEASSSRIVGRARRERHRSEIPDIGAKSLPSASFFDETQSRQGVDVWEVIGPRRIQTSTRPRSRVIWSYGISNGDRIRCLAYG